MMSLNATLAQVGKESAKEYQDKDVLFGQSHDVFKKLRYNGYIIEVGKNACDSVKAWKTYWID